MTLKLGMQFVDDGYNICIKKLEKAFLEFDSNVLENIGLKEAVAAEDVDTLIREFGLRYIRKFRNVRARVLLQMVNVGCVGRCG
ncbi:hypothetical protein F0562_030423 [Nyssa sinensis]|uniref:Uncharacterized protein n=1 Tax=Nyssa sinensis TaxID=561372 RepID=A0A5J5AZT9_9ASTE|nr:hypothetical protein F0562_030423 [Nyssa sinensis]